MSGPRSRGGLGVQASNNGGYRVLGRGAIAAAAASAGVIALALSVIDPIMPENGVRGGETISLAPVSLGNPAAAATLQTFRPSLPPDPPLGGLSSTVDVSYTIGRGDTLAQVLDRAGIGRSEAHGAISVLRKHLDLRKLRPGQQVTVTFQPLQVSADAAGSDAIRTGRFVGMRIKPDWAHVIEVARHDDGFIAHELDRPLQERDRRAAGKIDRSLYVDARAAGLPADVIAELIHLYSWDVDFQRDIHPGDKFEVLYQETVDDQGNAVHAGDILAATLWAGGKPIRLFRHKDKDGHVEYFDGKGHSAQKALMRTPIDGARLSSPFGKRKHPILGYTKMHTGVDFAAPRGTPIFAAGTGTVVYAGRNGGYGNYIRIRHNGTYQTAYGHMTRFAKKMHVGERVHQGDVIGYVGTTGRSTGPHLHYEILKSGHPVNPLRIKMPSGRALAGAELKRFEQAKAGMEAELTRLADADTAAAADAGLPPADGEVAEGGK